MPIVITNNNLKQYLHNHQLEDGVLMDLIDRKLYSAAVKELPRVIHSYDVKIFALKELENLIEQVAVEQDKLDQI